MFFIKKMGIILKAFSFTLLLCVLLALASSIIKNKLFECLRKNVVVHWYSHDVCNMCARFCRI